MGKIITNRQPVDAPTVGQRRYGLFNVVTPREMSERVVASGGQFYTDHCGGQANTYDQTCEVSPVKPVVEGADLLGFDPFWVVARKRCGSVGRTADTALAAVRDALLASEQFVVERAFWGMPGPGATPFSDPNLMGAPGVTVVVPTAPGAGAAIAALERAFYAEAGYVGTIHVSTAAYGALEYAGLLKTANPGQVPNTLRSSLGSPWAIGAGYGTNGPGGVAPAAGFVWAFMTSQVTMWSTPILPQPPAAGVFDRSLNQWDTVAEKVFGLSWECPEVFAVQVPLAAPATADTPAVPA